MSIILVLVLVQRIIKNKNIAIVDIGNSMMQFKIID
jgi:hypothetical protein